MKADINIWLKMPTNWINTKRNCLAFILHNLLFKTITSNLEQFSLFLKPRGWRDSQGECSELHWILGIDVNVFCKFLELTFYYTEKPLTWKVLKRGQRMDIEVAEKMDSESSQRCTERGLDTMDRISNRCRKENY